MLGKYNGCHPFGGSTLFCARAFPFLILKNSGPYQPELRVTLSICGRTLIKIHLEAVSGMLSFVGRKK
jgi:hypothetical protein